MIDYQFNCFSEDSYVGMTSRHFGNRIIEHIPKSINEFCKTSNKKSKSIRVVNASQRSAIAEHLEYNCDCECKHNLKRFSIIKIVSAYLI